MAKPIEKDPEPTPDPKTPPAPTRIPGPIGDRWRQLGGPRWGTPQFAIMRTGDGRGSYVGFTGADGVDRLIISTPTTGARVVFGEWNLVWRRTGGPTGSQLGYPTSDTLPTHDGVGRYQTFEGGVLVWHPSTGTHEVHGDINGAYARLGGSRFGYPTTDEQDAPDRRGRVNHFRDPATGAAASIYWTPDHGAFALRGPIHQAWNGYRGPDSLGYPTSDERATHDGQGRYQVFERCTYVWHPTTGAHEVSGAIAARYGALGGSVFGYPTTGVLVLADGRGRASGFRDVGTGAEKTIAWHPATAAYEVVGPIRDRWAALGWERSRLGYPTGGDEPWAGEAGGRRQSFQHGQALFSPSRGRVAVDPVDLVHDFGDVAGPTALEGSAGIRLHSDGTVHTTGRMRATGGESYHFRVSVVARQGSVAVAAGWQGHVGGTFNTDERSEYWDERSHSEAVRLNFWDLQDAALEARREFDGSILGPLQDLAEVALKFLGGALVVATGASGLVILVGGLAASVVTSGNFASGARVLAGTLWLAGPYGMMYALAAEGVARIGTEERGLRDHEWLLAQHVFGPAVPPRDSIRITDTSGADDRAFVFRSLDGKTTLNLGTHFDDTFGWNAGRWSDKRGRTLVAGEKFVHELVHAWQLEHGSDLGFVLQGLTKIAGEDYGYDPDRSFAQGLEPQASIVQDWFAACVAPGVSPEQWDLTTPTATGHPLYRFIVGDLWTGRV